MSPKLKIPAKNSLKGLKIFCTKCKLKNPKCNHYDKHRFRMHVYVPNNPKKELTKVLNALDYKSAFDEGYIFKKEMEACDIRAVKKWQSFSKSIPRSASISSRRPQIGRLCAASMTRHRRCKTASGTMSPPLCAKGRTPSHLP